MHWLFFLIFRSFSLDKTALTAYLSLPKYRNYILFCKTFYNKIFNFSNKSCRRVSETGPAISSPIGPKTAETTSGRRFVHTKQLHSAAHAPRNLPGCTRVLGDVFNGRTAWQDSKQRTHNLGLKTKRVANSICNPSPVLAESEGFEPPEPCGSTVFKTAAIDHSANFPETKVAPIFHSAKSPPRFYSTPANPELKFRR